jgi:hypothetical protein
VLNIHQVQEDNRQSDLWASSAAGWKIVDGVKWHKVIKRREIDEQGRRK